MKDNRGKLLAAFAIVMMVFCAFAALAPSSEGVAAESNAATEVGTSEALIDAVGSNNFNVKLTTDITLEAELTISITGTLDLNGQTLTNLKDKHTITVAKDGNLTVIDSSAGKTGKVDNVSHACAALQVDNGATVVLNGGEFTRSMENGKDSEDSGNNSFYAIRTYGNLTINDGVKVTQNGKYSSLIENGWYNGNQNSNKMNAVMTINGGTFNGGINTIKNDDWGVMTINGGTFTNMSQAVVMNWNELTITGGNFNDADSTYLILNGEFDETMGKGILNITGGTFVTKEGRATVSSNGSIGDVSIGDAESLKNVTVKIRAGTNATGSVSFGDNKVTMSGIVAGSEGITFSSGSIVISGTIDASQAVEITATGEVKLDGVVVTSTTTSGGLTIKVDPTGTNTVTVEGRLTVEEGATLNVNAPLTVAKGATLTNNGEIAATEDIIVDGALNNAGTVSGTGNVTGEGKVSNSGEITAPIEDGKLSITNEYKDVYVTGETTQSITFPQNQRVIVAAGTSWTISAGNTIIIYGDLVVDGQLIIEENGELILGSSGTDNNLATASFNGEVDNSGTITVENANVAVAGDLSLIAGKLDVKKTGADGFTVDGNLVVDSESVLSSAADIVVGTDGVLTVYGTVGDTSIVNKGTVDIDNGAADPVDTAAVNDTLTIKIGAAGAVVNVTSFQINATESKIVIDDSKVKVGSGNNATEIPAANTVEISVQNITDGAITLYGGLTVSETVSGNTTNGYTYNMVVTGQLSAAYTDTANNDEPAVDLKLMGAVDGTISIDKKDVKTYAGILVSETLTVASGVAVANSGALDVSGQLLLTCGTHGIVNSGEITIVGEDGLVRILTKDITGETINAVKYTTREAGNPTPVNYNNYASFSGAVAGVTAETNTNAAKAVEVLGKVSVSQDVDVPSPVTVTVTGTLNIGSTTSEGRDVTVTMADGTKTSGNGSMIVEGTLTYENKKNDGMADKTVADVTVEDEARDGYRTYTNIYSALSGASAGDVITVSKESNGKNAVVIGQDITVPADVTLVVPAGAAPLLLRNGVTMTVEGTLRTEAQVYAENEFDLKASNNTATGTYSSAIVVSGEIQFTTNIEYKYSANTAKNVITDVDSIDFSKCRTLASGSVVAGAYYSTNDFTSVISPLSVALQDDVLAEVYGDIVVNGTVTEGDLTFTATDVCKKIVIGDSVQYKSAPEATTIPTAVTVGSLTLDGSSVGFGEAGTGTLTGAITAGEATVTLGKVSVMTLEDTEKGFTVSGTATGDSVVFSAGTVTDKADLTGVKTVTVANGATVGSDGAKFDKVTVNGTLSVASNKNLEATTIVVGENGTLSVADVTANTAKGTTTITKLFVGLSDDFKASYSGAAVAGPISATTVYVVDGSAVDAAAQTVLDDMESTEFYVEDSLWMTAYGEGFIAEVENAPVENAKFNHWVNADGDEPKYEVDDKTKEVTGTEFGADEYEQVYADIRYDIYHIVLKADFDAVGSVSIDGNLMSVGMVSTDGGWMQAFVADIAAGSHQISFTLKNGYSGTGILSVNGQQQSGLSFTTTGTPEGEKNQIQYDLELTGIEKSGYTPDAPDTPGDDGGLTITDYLLIVLVVLIVVMAIIVAMRLMRS